MKTIFWNVDTQKDFMYNTGSLYVPGAEGIIPNLGRLTRMAKEYGVRVVNTADLHDADSAEISAAPDWKSTYPAHCMEGTQGQEFIPETQPKESYEISWKDPRVDAFRLIGARNITMYKDGTDIFEAPQTEKVMEMLNPGAAVVYGVVTNICVDKAVKGLCRRGVSVYVVTDAIKELPGCDVQAQYKQWEAACHRVQFVTTDGLEALLARR